MALEEQQRGDIRATLAVSSAEAGSGTTRVLTLPGGRQVTVSIPAGIRDGQELRLTGQGELPPGGGPAGTLILTIAVMPTDYASNTYYTPGGTDFPTESVTAPPPPPVSSSPNYPSRGGAFTNYPSQGTGGNYSYPSQPASAQYSWSQPSQSQQRRGLSLLTIIIVVLLALLLIGGGGLIYYAAVFQPAQKQAQATATAQAKLQGTAQANATATAQVIATTQAQAHATATAIAQANAQATATATALQNIYTQATSGTPALNDPLKNQDNNSWSEGTSCAFTGGAYHISQTQKNFFTTCFAQSPTFDNFAFQVQMVIIKGDNGGITFRSDSTNVSFYRFSLNHNGSYLFDDYQNNKELKMLSSGFASPFKTGLNQSNLITVVARGSKFYLFVNQQFVASVSDNTYSSGKIGVFGGVFDTPPADVAFSNAQVWKL